MVWLIFALMLPSIGCAHDPAPDDPVEVALGGVMVATQDLGDLAARMREDARHPVGIVVGQLVGPIEPGSPERLDSGDYWIDFGRDVGTVVVADSLGWEVPRDIPVHATDGMPPTITDVDGNPLVNYIVTEWSPPQAQKTLAVGEFVFFVVDPPSSEGWTLLWRAELRGSDGVSGEGTVSGRDVPLAELSLSPPE
jgi:hypothetical protein